MKKPLLIILIIVAVLIVGIVVAAFVVTNSDKNMPNLYVGDIDISQMTAEETAKALEDGGWEKTSTTDLDVSLLGVLDFEVNPVEAGVLLSSEDAANAAAQYGHGSNIFENLYLFAKGLFTKTDLNDLYTTINDDYIDGQIMQGLDYLNEYCGLEECTLDFENAELTTVKGWGQLDFDNQAMKDAIISTIKSGNREMTYSDLTKELEMPDFAKINDGLEKTTVDATYTDDGKFDVIDETDACEFDVTGAEKLWTQAAPGEKVVIPMTVTKAEVTGQQLRDQLYHDLLGTMTTRYTNSADERCSNVRLCASKINEVILYPGETFSYNETVGKRTEEAGFLPAPAYVGLDSEETVKNEIGGGACQVSSTLYAATLFAFLETVDRSCHIYPVNYMQLGIDATVTIPDDGQEVDFKFKNNKNYPIKIVAYTEENDEEKKLTVEIWGTLEDDDYMPVCFDASYLWSQDYCKTITPAQTGRDGYIIKLLHDTYTDASDSGTITSTQTHRLVYQVSDSIEGADRDTVTTYETDANLVEDTIVNLPNPATGEPSMDQYHQHP